MLASIVLSTVMPILSIRRADPKNAKCVALNRSKLCKLD